MGNGESVQQYQLSGLKRTQESDNNAVYRLVNLKADPLFLTLKWMMAVMLVVVQGGGELVSLMQSALKNGDYSILDQAIQTKVAATFHLPRQQKVRPGETGG